VRPVEETDEMEGQRLAPEQDGSGLTQQAVAFR